MPHKDPAAQKAYLKSYHAKWYQANKEKRLAQIELYQTTKSDDWRKLIGQKHHLKTRYNLTPEQYNEMAKQQDYKCAICNIDVTDNIRANKQIALSVDHNHTTGTIRELLCMKCNYGLGYFRDDFSILQKASNYLKNTNNIYNVYTQLWSYILHDVFMTGFLRVFKLYQHLNKMHRLL